LFFCWFVVTMGLSLSTLANLFFSNKERRVLMVGLDAAGKTTILYKLKLGEVITTVPTIGFNVEEVKYKNLNFTVWDIGGQDKLRNLWRYYFEGSDAVIFVVDSSDRDRIALAAEELGRIFEHDELKDASLLVYANKQDLPMSLSVQEVAEGMGLTKLRNRNWHVQGCTAPSGDGLYEGLDWLSRAVCAKK